MNLTFVVPAAADGWIVAQGYAQRGDFMQAMSLLHRMREQGMRPNDITFNTLMDAAIRSK